MRPVAPDGMVVPQWVAARLDATGASHDELILQHGFTEDAIKPAWWQKKLTKAGLADEGTLAITFPSRRDDGTPVLTRGDLFTMATALRTTEKDDPEWLRFLWHVLAWGSGTSRRNNPARIEAFSDPELRKARVEYLREAAKHVWAGDPRRAYSALILPGKARIPRLGPAFFTKFLYFAAGGSAPANGETTCLILDSRVVASLRTSGWESLPSGNYNWYTDTYVSYCELLHRWARELNARNNTRPTSADEIERVLFEGQPSTWGLWI
ncbi:8-oxoguanine DNA glycosylase OGG fold protein [Georgenia yuyongxinii]